jgi:hypothetical protein
VDFLAPEGTPVYAVADGTVCAPPACVFGKTEEEKKDKNSLQSFTLLGASPSVARLPLLLLSLDSP